MMGHFVNNELETTWKEMAVVSFKISSRYSPGGAEETHEKPHSE
jgi:hypothetical protein